MSEPENSEETTTEVEEEENKPKWRYQSKLPIQEEMAKVIKLTIEASKKQLEQERKKLRKLQYGS